MLNKIKITPWPPQLSPAPTVITYGLTTRSANDRYRVRFRPLDHETNRREMVAREELKEPLGIV